MDPIREDMKPEASGAPGTQDEPLDPQPRMDSIQEEDQPKPAGALGSSPESGSPSLEDIRVLLDCPNLGAPGTIAHARVPETSRPSAQDVVDQPKQAEPVVGHVDTDRIQEEVQPETAGTQSPPAEPWDIRPHESYPLALDHTNVAAAESFGIVRSRLLRAHGKGIRSVVITSPGMKEGKTLSAVNLGLSFGQLAQRRVLLIDGDLRAAGATRLLKLQDSPGLADLLIGEKPYEAVAHATRFPCLFVVPAGNVPEKALPELLESSRWPDFIDYAKQHFDIVIVDSIPMGAPVADLELLSAACDALLLVVQVRKTTRESLTRIQTRLDRRKLLGVLVNAADQLSNYSGYYYHGYYPKQEFAKQAGK